MACFFSFSFSDCLFISFALMQKKRTKEKIKAALPGLLRGGTTAEGQELASLRQPALLNAVAPPSALRPYSEAKILLFGNCFCDFFLLGIAEKSEESENTLIFLPASLEGRKAEGFEKAV